MYEKKQRKNGITFKNLAEKTGNPIEKIIEFESGEFEQIKASELEKMMKKSQQKI